MYYDLDKVPIDVIKKGKALDFIYNKKEYFFKEASYEEMLKELVAEKIAKRFKIPCCHYFPATYKGVKGVVSESAFGLLDVGYKTMEEYLFEKEGYSKELFDNRNFNNMENIWNTFHFDLSIPHTNVKKMMNEITDIFIFDVLIGNSDRHIGNYGVIIDGKNSRMAPIFDNDSMLSGLAIDYGKYWLAVEEKETPLNTPINFLYKFLTISDKTYHKRLKDGLEIISEESLIEIFKELETEGIILNNSVVVEMLIAFEKNRGMINNYFESKKEGYSF